MPRSTAPLWRRRKEPILDDYVRASISRADGKYDADGHYATLVVNGVESREAAREVVQALYRSGLWLHRHTDLRCSVWAKEFKNADGSYRVEFKAINKDHAQAYIDNKHGPDPENRPYSPYKFHKNFNAPGSGD